MNKYIFSEEEINKILLNSPMALPNNPLDHGLKGSNIKTFFYAFIRRLMLLINEHFSIIENDKDSSILEHNEGDKTHGDIRGMINDLIQRDTELGNAISQHYEEINGLFLDAEKSVDGKITSHNNDINAHTQMKYDISVARAIAENAYDFAQGKSKIIPVKSVYEMTTKLSPSLNIGDKFVLSDKNVPDFTLFEKESTASDAISFTQVDLMMGNIEFKPGESYICNGYLLVASESGIDTSLFANQEDISAIEKSISDLVKDTNTAVDGLIEKLSLKENAITVVNETAEEITLSDKTEYNLGLRTSIILALPDQISTDFECIINFRSGTTATTFDIPNAIILTQNDCTKGILTPISNRIYEISIKNVNGVLIGKVGSTDYEVIE